MSRKENLLKCLNTLELELSQVSKADNDACDNLLVAFMKNMATTQNLCLQGLTEVNYAKYGKIYDEMIVTAKEVLESDKAKQKKHGFSKCRELIKRLIHKTERETRFKKDIVFLPYKASMWDSLESVWQAAYNDKDNCNAYVVPVPYAERNPDGSVARWRLEREEFPQYVPTLDWQTVNLEAWHPDVIVIHNPYDDLNKITSVEAHFYSKNLKQFTDKLIYIPYYATSGGMLEGQAYIPSYENMDYIVVQSEKFRKLFDKKIPGEKLLPLGSPKFDRVIRLCQTPPEPPADWQEKMRGKKVYFFNTSLGGALGGIQLFLQKLQYVFATFKNRADTCLLWRPHPLLEAGLKSMTPEYLSAYEQIRDSFLKDDFGIYDTTPDIEKSIALSDAYIGDSATSVTALFGVAGKPIFYLNNMYNAAPENDDWLGSINRVWDFRAKNWLIPYGNQLWYSPKSDLHYSHCLDLSEYNGAGYYGTLLELDDKLFVTPNSAQDIVVVENEKISRRIPLEKQVERLEAFAGAVYAFHKDEDYFFLAPFRYPAVVRYDFRHDKLDYAPCDNNIFVRDVLDEKWRGSVLLWDKWLIFASPVDSWAFMVNRDTLETHTAQIGGENCGGSMFTVARNFGDDEQFFIPYAGRKITHYNLRTGERHDYDLPENFKCVHPIKKYLCDIRPFSSAIFKDDNTLLLAPLWGNMFIKLHIDTGVVEEWKTPFTVTVEGKNNYYFAWTTGHFIVDFDKTWRPTEYHFYYAPTRTRYKFNPQTEEFTLLEHDAVIDEAEFRKHLPGFCEQSGYAVYGCNEDAFNSLKDFVDDNISGNKFDKEKQLAAYETIAANLGYSGEKIYDFIKGN